MRLLIALPLLALLGSSLEIPSVSIFIATPVDQSPVLILSTSSTTKHFFDQATFRNTSEKSISLLTFSVTLTDVSGAKLLSPIRLKTGAVRVAPEKSSSVEAMGFPVATLIEQLKTVKVQHANASLSVLEVEFDDDSIWKAPQASKPGN